MSIARILSLFCPKRPATPACSLSLPYTRLTLAEWKASQERVAYARELLRTPLFLELVGMLANLRPSYGGVQDGTHAALLLGQQAGHDTVIATLLAAGSGDAPAPAALEADYMAKNVMQEWDEERNM